MTIVRNDFTTNRLTVIVDDNTVYTDIAAYVVNLSACGIPEDIHALQYWSGDGEIEYRGPIHNDKFTGPEGVPEWALKALDEWITTWKADPNYPNVLG